MNEKEIGEIRRRFRPDKNNITNIHVCYVNEKKEIVSQSNQPMSRLSVEESENILAILKKTLSGALGKNLLDITFDTKQVADSDEHRLLMALKNSALKDEKAVQTFLELAIQNITIEGSYLILLTYDTYDVMFRSKDGEKQADASSEVYSYILCSVCPIKAVKPELTYYIVENEFRNCQPDRLISPPELGFIFPAFDDRRSNIYNALYYSRNLTDNHQEFVDNIFHTPLPMPPAAQKETFEAMLSGALDEDCNYEVVQAVHGKLCELISDHKANKDEEPLVISKGTVKKVLQDCGVSESHVNAFDKKYDTEFGEEVKIPPQNIVNTKQFEVYTPDVTIHVNPQRSDLVKIQIINGTKYILVRADENVEVNGVNIQTKNLE